MSAKSIGKYCYEFVLLAMTVLFVFPLYYCVINAFKSPLEISKHPFTIGFDTFTFNNIIQFFIKAKYPLSFFYTSMITGIALILIILFCSMARRTLWRVEPAEYLNTII